MPGRGPAPILFDLDGTLVDSVAHIVASARHAFEGYGGGPTDAEWLAGVGTPLRQQIAAFTRTPEDVGALLERYRAYWRANHDQMVRPFPGAVETVALLAVRGHPIGVVTSKLEAGALRTLQHAGLTPHVSAVVGADTCARAKPHPEPVLLALERLGGFRPDAIFLGDSVHDVAAGRGAGVRTIGALWGVNGREVLAAAGAQEFLEDIRELPGLVAAAA